MKQVRWGLLAAGNIAKAFAAALGESESGKALAVASRSAEKAGKFAEEFKIPRAYGSYGELLADAEIDAVYISTPHPMHAEWAIKAADAGKHILCEKPLTMNQYDAMTVIEAARRNDVFLMEAFMYRCNPQTARLVELIRDGAIGQVRIINAVFSFQCGYNLQSRLLKAALGGGGILDVGCYTVSMSRLLAGAALGRDFADPIDVQAAGHVGAESRVDEWTSAVMRFEGDIVARVSTGVQVNQDSTVTVHGSGGRIHVPAPWFCNGRVAGKTTIHLARAGKQAEEIVVDVPKGIYAIEADVVTANIERRQAPAPAMSWADTMGNMAALDRWRKAIGVNYPCETVEAYATPLDKRTLRIREPNRMSYGTLPGVQKDISRLIMGTMTQKNIANATALFDDFFARGGNAFDTAYIYGGGDTERFLGQWIANRGLREQVVVIIKGAHSPHCNPKALVEQFNESLERIQSDYADIYFMHRDNPEIPAGEFVDVLNELKDAGRLRAFGGSNWTKERFAEANDYARRAGKTPFAAVSNNFSLAQMVNPVWAGCVASSTPQYRAWHKAGQVPLFAWSSQARGFFIPGRAGPDKLDNAHMVHCWYSDDNFERRRRCFELAEKRRVEPVTIALAYALHQPFPLYAMIGPATINETVDSFRALDVALSEKELEWLNLEDRACD